MTAQANVHFCRHCGCGHPSWGCKVMAEKRHEDMKRIGSLPTDVERQAAYEAYTKAERESGGVFLVPAR